MGEWQPIETAPHGQRVLLGWRDWCDHAWCMEVGPASHGYRNQAVSNISRHGSATHWMPLPTPPDEPPAQSDGMTDTVMKQPSPELLAALEDDRKVRADRVAKVWRKDLSHKDWLFDGRPITGRVMLARWENLNWDKAWMDLGPSIAGNLGPYWHVPLRETVIDGEVYDLGDTTHRLYPKILQGKWAMLILHACNEAQRRERERRI